MKNMAKFICKSCGFRTEREKLDKCPYCDRNSMEIEKSAAELLDDISPEE